MGEEDWVKFHHVPSLSQRDCKCLAASRHIHVLTNGSHELIKSCEEDMTFRHVPSSISTRFVSKKKPKDFFPTKIIQKKHHRTRLRFFRKIYSYTQLRYARKFPYTELPYALAPWCSMQKIGELWIHPGRLTAGT